MKIAVVGTGYVGLVSGTCLADIGHHVTCVDIDSAKVETLKAGNSPIFEPGLESVMKRCMKHNLLFFTTDLKVGLENAEAVFIAVGTPEGEDGSADLGYVMNVAEEIGRTAKGPMMAVVKSTVPVGTCDLVEKIINSELGKRGVDFSITVASNPEFLKEGAAIADFMKPDRIVVGITNDLDQSRFEDIYEPFVRDDRNKIMVMSRRSSEMTKYASNAMLATRISFMNELSRLTEAVGADIEDIRRGMGMDSRIGRKFLYSGPGYGGSCFPKDVSALVKTGQDYDIPMTILETVESVNEQQKQRMANKVLQHFDGNLEGKTIAIWGLAFKPSTDDVRETPSQVIVERLLAAGAKVQAHDPEGEVGFRRLVGERPGLQYASSGEEAILEADALVLVTEWHEYLRPNWSDIGEKMREKVVFDLRNQYSFKDLERLGFAYYSVGRPDSLGSSQMGER